MSDYEITFNVYDGSSGSLGDAFSASGHGNVTFNDNTSGFSVTVGANQTSLSGGTAFRGFGDITDGVIQFEDDKLEPGQFATASRSVPVTREQFEAISQLAIGLAEQGHQYDYSLFSSSKGHAQTCADWMEAIYQATGHPGTVGDLFSYSDIESVPGLVWGYIGVNTLGIPVYIPVGPIEGHVPDLSGAVPSHCFLSDTPIQMWPLDPSIKPCADGSYDEAFVLSKVWEKPIVEIAIGDLVVSYDAKGRLAPKPVTRTMENFSTHILDFWGTGVTPGHAYFCSDGKFKDQHVPLMDILRTDGAIMRTDGTVIRAATNCEVGSLGDLMVHAAATLQKPDGSWTPQNAGKVRFGTRIILPNGRHTSFLEMAQDEGWKVSDVGYMVATMVGADGTVAERAFHFPYAFDEELPKPEDYILARSDISLEAIYAAGEWEQIGTRMPAPDGMDDLNNNHTSTLLQPSKPEPNIPPAFAKHRDVPNRSEPVANPAQLKIRTVH